MFTHKVHIYKLLLLIVININTSTTSTTTGDSVCSSDIISRIKTSIQFHIPSPQRLVVSVTKIHNVRNSLASALRDPRLSFSYLISQTIEDSSFLTANAFERNSQSTLQYYPQISTSQLKEKLLTEAFNLTVQDHNQTER